MLEAGLTPDVILGDMDSASDAALRCGAELVVHAYPDGAAPGCERLERLGLEHLTVLPRPARARTWRCCSPHEKGAELIVRVGAHFNLIEFLDKNRDGMSSTFLTRLRIGETLVDAKGVSRLYNPGVGARPGGAVPGRLRRAAGDRDRHLAGARRVLRADLAEDQGLLELRERAELRREPRYPRPS